MKAAVMTEVGKIEMHEKEIPTIGKDEILVKIEHVGICGSDIHYFEHGRIGDFVVDKPIILGHESAGIVVDKGSNVTHLSKGDRVAIEPGYTCGKCEYCLKGQYNLCPEVVFMATPPYDGAFVEYVSYPAYMAFKLPDNVDTIEGALIEPLAVGFHAAKQGDASIGKTAVVLGSGCIGLCTMMAAKAMGVTDIYITDVLQKRLDMADDIGATKAINAKDKDVVKTIMDLTNGQGVDIVFETAGSSITTKQTIELVKRGGKIVLVGLAADSSINYDFGKLISKEASINTVFRYKNIYPTAIKAVSAGLIPLKKIVTDKFKFDDTHKAMEYSIQNKKDIVKAVIEM